MAHTLASVRDQVEVNLMDSTNLIWSTSVLDEAIRASLADISRAYDLALFLNGLDGAPATTVTDLDIYVLVKGAVAHALVFRVVGRYEEATPEPNITPELASLAELRMKEFRQYLIPIYAASGVYIGDDDHLLWQSAENLLDRAHAVAMQDDQQLWASAESVLDRAHKVAESALDRAAKEGLQDDLLTWKEAEAVLDRAHKVSESALDRANKVSESALDRGLVVSEGALDRAAKDTLQDDLLFWKSAEAVLDRAHTVSEAALNRGLVVSEGALDRAAKEALQDDLLIWRSAEAVLDRAHKVSEAALDRAAKLALQDDQQAFLTAEAVLDRQAKADLQDDQQTWKTGESALDRAHELTILQEKYDREDDLKQAETDRLTAFQNSDVPPYSQWEVDI